MAVGEKLKRKKTTAAAELPEEIIRHEILTRLPIKSAARFKCVSKSWLSLFSDPRFVKEHFTRNTTQNPNDCNNLIANKDNKIVILSRYKETLALRTPKTLMIELVGSIRGLVCLYHQEKLSLWNPAIHQSKEFTLPPRRCGDRMSIMGFGFDHANDIYKVVIFSQKLRSASVYYSNVDSWIDVCVPDNVYLLQNRGFFTESMTIVKDCPYWIFSTYKEKKWIAVKFDAETNEFKLLPEFHGERYRLFSLAFVEMNDCLALIVCHLNSFKRMFDIYSLDGEEGCSWSKMYKTRPLNCGIVTVSQGFFGGEIVFRKNGVFSCYDHETNTIMRLSTTTPDTLILTSPVSCFRYTPSLVFLEGMKYVYLTTQTLHTSGRCSPQRLINSLGNYHFIA